MSSNGQIPLNLPLEPAISREDLLESRSNQLAVSLIDNWPDWPSNILILAGPIGSGKTHLAKIWAQTSNAKVIPANELANHSNICEQTNLVLEDITKDNLPEESLFHALNQARASKHFVMVTSRVFPSSWMVTLPDLASRLKLAHLVELQEPDDQLLSGVIVKLFADRQLEVSPTIIEFLVTRMERSLDIAGKLVNWLDQEALARHSKINRKLAHEALLALGLE